MEQAFTGGVSSIFNQKTIFFFFFDLFSLEGLKIFIVDNHQQIINELLYNFKECESKPAEKLKLCTMKFCVETWQKMSQKTKDQLTDTAQKNFHLIEQFAKLKKSHCMNLLILKNAIQEITTDTCGEFQLYFYKNLIYKNLFLSTSSKQNFKSPEIK